MKSLLRPACALAFAGIMLGVLYAQRPFRVYPSVEGYDAMPLPRDWQRSAEWTFARLMYPPGPLDGYYPRFQGDWRKGLSLWTQDYPRADRALSAAVGRLTTAHSPQPSAASPASTPAPSSSPSTSTTATKSTTGPGSTLSR